MRLPSFQVVKIEEPSEPMAIAMIRGLVDWKPVENPQPGYTIVIGCSARLLAMLPAMLLALLRWRSREAWLLLLCALMPQRVVYDQLTLLLVARTPRAKGGRKPS